METTAEFYQSIFNLPLSKFKECEVKGNLHALVISGDPDIELLRLAWQEIVLEFNDLMQDNESKMYKNLAVEVALLETKLAKIDAAIDVLKGCMQYYENPGTQTEAGIEKVNEYVKKYSALLNEFVESSFPFDTSKKEAFFKDLKRAKTRSGSLVIKLGLKKSNLEKLEPKNTDPDKKPSYEYYDSILNELTVFTKTFIDDNILTSRFCDLVLKYNRHMKFLESQNKK